MIKTITRHITITIDRCEHCTYFVRADLKRPQEWCKYHNKNLKSGLSEYIFPIPDWCEVEKDKGDGQYIPRNFEG